MNIKIAYVILVFFSASSFAYTFFDFTWWAPVADAPLRGFMILMAHITAIFVSLMIVINDHVDRRFK